jgi:hypothetical protein
MAHKNIKPSQGYLFLNNNQQIIASPKELAA